MDHHFPHDIPMVSPKNQRLYGEHVFRHGHPPTRVVVDRGSKLRAPQECEVFHATNSTVRTKFAGPRLAVNIPMIIL